MAQDSRRLANAGFVPARNSGARFATAQQCAALAWNLSPRGRCSAMRLRTCGMGGCCPKSGESAEVATRAVNVVAMDPEFCAHRCGRKVRLARPAVFYASAAKSVRFGAQLKCGAVCCQACDRGVGNQKGLDQKARGSQFTGRFRCRKCRLPFCVRACQGAHRLIAS